MQQRILEALRQLAEVKQRPFASEKGATAHANPPTATPSQSHCRRDGPTITTAGGDSSESELDNSSDPASARSSRTSIRRRQRQSRTARFVAYPDDAEFTVENLGFGTTFWLLTPPRPRLYAQPD